jgi:hypothetical protein
MAPFPKLFKLGQSMVEMLVAIGLAAIILPAIYTGLISSRQGALQSQYQTTASNLRQQAYQAARILRDSDWTNFATFSGQGDFHPVISGNSWTLASGSELINDLFTRSIQISDVYRNSSGAIVAIGGNPDPSTKRVVSQVSWPAPLPAVVSDTSYLTRLENLLYTQTTEADFDSGIHSSTTTTNTAGGEIILGSGGQGDWCSPDLSITALDLPKSGVANAITAIEGHAFAGTGDNASGISYANISISNANPPIASLTNPGTFDGYKTNDIHGESGYAFIGTDNNAKEVEIINLSSNPYSEAGYFNAPGNGNGKAVFTTASFGFMTSGNKFYAFDLSSKSGSRPQVGGEVTLAGIGNKVVVNGTYAYVAIGNSSTQLQIIDVSNPNNLSNSSIIGQASVSGQNGLTLAVNTTGTRTYLATGSSASQSEFFIIDTSTKNGNQPVIGSYDTLGMNPKGIAVATSNKIIIIGTGAEEYQTINVSNESLPIRCGGMSIDTGINGIATVVEQDGDAWSYLITGDATSEFKIIAGGPGGQFATTGTFTSSIFDVTTVLGPDRETAFNRINVTADVPVQTSLSFQIAIADPISGSCTDSNYVYVGPDGTSSTFFAPPTGVIPLNDDNTGYENPAGCFRYRAFLSTNNAGSTPVLYDVSVNYSP